MSNENSQPKANAVILPFRKVIKPQEQNFQQPPLANIVDDLGKISGVHNVVINSNKK